jgi:hypothetical protein
VALKSNTAAEESKDQLSRDFLGRSILLLQQYRPTGDILICSKQPWHQFLPLPRQHEIQLLGDPIGRHRLPAPFGDTTGVLPQKPHMVDRNEKLRRLKIRMGQFAYRAITSDEGMPKGVILSPKQARSEGDDCAPRSASSQ